jgi:hypothetical protein
MPEIVRTQPRANALAKSDVTSKVTTEFTTKTDTLVADLNQRTSWKDTLAIVPPNGEQRVRRLTTTPISVEIRSSVVDAEIPDLPAESQSLRAQIELWVLGQPGPVMSAELPALWGLSRLAIKPIQQKAEAAAERLGENHEDSARSFEPELFGEWWVLRLGADLMGRARGKANDAGADAKTPGSENEAVPDESRQHRRCSHLVTPAAFPQAGAQPTAKAAA